MLIGDPLVSHYVMPGMSSYSCSKSALEQFAYHINSEFEAHDIKVHYFLPPPIETPLLAEQRKMYPLVTRVLMKNHKSASPEYAAQLLLRGISMG